MNCEISEALKKLAAAYDRATTQKERDRLTREIARVSRKEELDREGTRRRSTNKGRFAASMLSLDEHMAKFDDPSKAAVFSDGGAGAERIVSACDGGAARRQACVKRAMNRLRNRPELRRTLQLVIKHWPRREDAIRAILASRRCPTWNAARKQYFAHLKKLLRIFCVQ